MALADCVAALLGLADRPKGMQKFVLRLRIGFGGFWQVGLGFVGFGWAGDVVDVGCLLTGRGEIAGFENLRLVPAVAVKFEVTI